MIKLYNFKYILALPLFLLCFCLQAQTLMHNNNISVNTTSLEWTLTGSSLSPVVTDFELFENTTGQTAGTYLTLITINSGTEYRIIANISTLKTDTDQFKLQFNSTDATKNYIIDETAPSAPSLLRIHEDFDLGTSNSDNITNMTSLLFQVTAEVGSTITLYDGGSNLIAIGPCTGTNVFIGVVAAGTQNIQAYATDIAGNISSVTTTSITVDTTVPSTPNTPDLLTSSDSGTSTADDITNSTTPTFTLSGLTNTTGFKVQLESDKDGVLETVLITGTSQDVTLSSSLSEGVHQISAKMIDVAGNESTASSNLSLTIDTTIPVTPSITLNTNSDTGRDNSDYKSTDLTPTFTIVSPVGSTITLYEGSNTKGTLTSTGSDQITSSIITSGAVYNYTVKVNDIAGNESNVSNTIVYDLKNITIPPLTLPILNGASDSGIIGDGKTNNTTPIFNFTGLTNVDSREIIVNSSIDGEVGRETITGINNNITLTTLSEGTHTISYFIEDVYGNISTTGNQVLIIDTTPPSLSSVSIVSDNGVNSELVENGNTSTLSFTANELLRTTSTVVLGGQNATLSNIANDYTASYLFSNPANYVAVSFSISLEDEAGNLGTSVTSTTDGSQNYFYPALTNVITAPTSTQFCDGDLVSFTTPSSSASGGAGGYVYNWERRLGAGGYVSLNYSHEQLVENTNLSVGTYTYRRSVESDGITLNSNTFSVNVINGINNIISSPADTEYCNSANVGGVTINTTTASGGTGTFSYQWQYAINGGGWINDGTSSNYTNSVIFSTNGNYSFRRIVSSGACTSISNEVDVEINPSISSNTINNISGNTVCLGDAIVLIGSIPTGGNDSYTYQWYRQRNGGSFNSIPGATSQSYYNASVSNPGQYIFRREVTSGSCTSPELTSIINVPALISTFNLEPSTTSHSDIQTIAVPLNVTGLVSGETFYCSGPGVVSTGAGSGNNNFYPNLATQGTHTINYHITGSDGCEQVEAVVFNIYDGSSVISVGAQYCEDDAAVTLTVPVQPSFTGTGPYTLVRFEGDGTSGMATPSGATFTPADVLAANPSVLDGQNYSTTLTAVYEDSSIPVVEYSVSQSVIITKNHIANINLSQLDFCEDDAPFSVDANVDGVLSSSGGVFDLDGGALVSNNSIIINPRNLSLGSHTLRYTYTDNNINSCSVVDVITFNVNRLPTVGYRYVSSGDDGHFCFDGDTVFLQGIANSVDVTSGSFSTLDAVASALIDNNDGTAYFIPSQMGLDIYDSDEDYTITFSYTDGVGCLNDADSVVTIYGFDEVGLAFSSSSDSVCYSDGDVLITPMEGLSAYAGNGTYTISSGGLTSNMDGTASFNPSVASVAAGETSTSDYSMHIITYTYDNLEGCLLSINDTLYVKPLPSIPSLTSSVPSYCSNDVALAPIQVTGETGASFVWYSDVGLTSVVSSSNTLTPSNAPNVSALTTVSYYVVQTNTDVCTSDPLQVDILIYSKPVAPLLHAANQTTYCSGEIVNSLSVATAGTNIKWYSDAVLSTQVGFGDTFTPALNTNVSSDSSVTYYVTETTNGCEGPSTLVSIQIYKTPNPPTVNLPAVMCSGGTLSSLTILSGTNVQWYSDASGNNYLASGNNYLPSFPTDVLNDSTVSYYATSTINGCESVTTEVSIIINALPALPSVSNITPYCEAEIILPITVSGETGATYKWYSDSDLTLLASVNQTFDPMRVAPTYSTLDTLNYWVVQVGTDGCESLPQKVDIPVYPTPIKPVIDNPNLTYCSGDIVNSLSVSTAGANIKWYSDALLSTQVGFGDSFTPALNTNVSSDSSVIYYVTETLNGCESPSTLVSIQIYKTPDVPSINTPLAMCSGGTLSSLTIATGINVQWYSDAAGINYLGSGNNYLPSFATDVLNDSTVSYYATSTINGCESTTTEVSIIINALPASPSVPNITPYCEAEVILPMTASGETGATYKWYSDSDLTLLASVNQTFDPMRVAPAYSTLDTLNYWVVQVGTDGCESLPQKVDITVYPTPLKPVIDNPNPVYCSGDIIQAINVTTGSNIKWYSDAVLSTQVGLGVSYTPIVNTNVSSDSLVTYYVTETMNGCESPSTLISIQIYKTPSPPTFNAPAALCSGGTLSILTIDTGVNVQWYSDASGVNYLGSGNNYRPSFSTNVLNDSIVSFYATSTINGCESPTAAVDIIINALPAIPSVPDITPYCEAETILPITVVGETGATFKWYSDIDLTSLESVNQTFDPARVAPTYSTLDTLNYWVVQVGTDGCESLPQKVDIPVYPTPTKPIIDNSNPIYCSGDVIQPITVIAGINIKWYDDVALTSIVSTTTSFTPPDPNSSSDFSQKYFVTQTVNGCESDTTQVTFVVNKTPGNPSVTATLNYCSGDVLQPMIVTGLVDDITWYSDASLTNTVGTTNTFTPTDNTVVTAETTYTYYVTDTHLGCEGSATQLNIVVHPLPVFDLFGIEDGDVFCKSDNNPLIITTVSGGVLTSPTGALIRTNNEVVLENSPLGVQTIRYTYTNENGCLDFIERSFTIVDVPVTAFGYDVFCDTRTVEFRDESVLQDSTNIISWQYDFGVGESSVTLTDSLTAASYQYTFNTAGFKTVVLTVITNQGCSEISSTETIFIGTPPEVAFEWSVSEFGADMLFMETSMANEIDTLSVWQWDFGDGTIEIIDALTNVTGATRHRYSQVGEYDVELMVTTTKGCSKILTEKVYVLPRVSLISEDDEYIENFNSSDGDWVHRGDSSSWDYGIASGTDLMTETNAWVTNLSSNYHFNEHSFLYTPSFDISGLSRPMITFDMQFDMETDVDGLTLQYSLDSGQTWNILGSVDDPINWYNSEDVSINPGNQLLLSGDNPIGWSGSTVEEGAIFREFKSIRHSLDQFIGQEHLQFRFAFRSNSALVHEGVVIDNVFIGNRKKVVVLESMTNAGQLSDSRSFPRLDSVLNYLSEDAFAINYHIKLSGYSDSLNTDNPEPSSGRKFYYGITDAPNTIVDGNSFQGHTDDFIDNYQNYIATRALLDPEFDISLQLPSIGSTNEIEITITANTEFSSDETEIVVHLVTVEREIFGIEVSRGLSTHTDVMKSMSPAPGAEGTSFVGRSWVTGSSETFTVEWDNPQVYDTDQAEVIAFVQNNLTKEIYQAIRLNVSALTSSDPILSINPSDKIEWEVYPNPSSDIVNISAPLSLIDCSYIVSNTNGKKILEDRFTGNTYSIDVNSLPTGVYIVQHFQGDEIIGQPLKFVVVK
ncbi:T9SS type A sorting domain-containing protein [Flammeovirga pectinis]|uniref:T9SS type A sorting domain-containing protein n=1 Tax=Flammeovirga pectinis TaxID=2494373 RepID=A0A3S9P2U9_9BACT|nr:Ig-like domain-containing protein [Flammeovirga pectinis]AZQ62531.1 T9SS type A sorting domain-containing protein [Flammeovirga pectinis]